MFEKDPFLAPGWVGGSDWLIFFSRRLRSLQLLQVPSGVPSAVPPELFGPSGVRSSALARALDRKCSANGDDQLRPAKLGLHRVGSRRGFRDLRRSFCGGFALDVSGCCSCGLNVPPPNPFLKNFVQALADFFLSKPFGHLTCGLLAL